MTSALRLRKHRTGGVLALGGRSMGRSGPWIGAHSTGVRRGRHGDHADVRLGREVSPPAEPRVAF
jgi:hypothetical protein